MANKKDIAIRLSLSDSETVRRGLERLGIDGQRALAKIEAQSAPASRGLLAINAASGDLRAGMQAAANRMGALGSGLAALGPAGLAAAAGIGAVVVGLSRAMRAAQQALTELDQLGDTATKLGVTAEQLQELQYAAEQEGVAVNVLNMAWQRFTRRLGEAQVGQGELVKTLQQYRIELRNTDGSNKSAIEVYRQLADRVAAVRDPQERLRIAFKAFDSEGAALVNLLAKGSAGLDDYAAKAREFGAVIDEDMVQRAGETNDQLATLHRIIDANLNASLIELAPILVSIAEGFADIARFVGQVVDGLRDMENRTTRGLENHIAQLQEFFDRVPNRPDSYFVGREWDVRKEEIDRLRSELARRKGASEAAVPLAGGLQVANPEQDKRAKKVTKVTEALRFQAVQMQRSEELQRIFQELQRAGVSLYSDEGKVIGDLVQHIYQQEKAIAATAEAKKKGEALTKQQMTAEQNHALAVAEINRLLAEGVITQETASRAMAEAARSHEEAEQRRLRASREAADGIKRAGRDMVEAATDSARQWEDALKGFSSTARDSFTDVLMGARTMRDGLRSIFQQIQRQIFNALYDRTIGAAIGNALGAAFGGLGGGMATATARPPGGGGISFNQPSGVFLHTGGMIGRDGYLRSVLPAMFEAAPRFHDGGRVGLRHNERPIIALEGERVLTEAQQDNTARVIANLARLATNPQPVVNLTIQNSQAEQVQTRAEVGRDRGGGLNLDVIVEQIEGKMARNIGRGQGLAPVLEGTYGLDRAVGARR